MSWVAVAVAGSAIVGGAISQDSANEAEKGQEQGTKAGIEAQKSQTAISRADQAPYRSAGEAGLTKLRDLLGIGVSSQGDWKTQLKKGYADVFLRNPNLNPDALTTINGVIDKSSSPTDTAPYGDSIFGIASKMGVARPDNLGEVLALPTGTTEAGAAAGPTSESIMAMDPGYQFRMDQGNKAVTNAANAAGMRNSGATLKALTRYGQDYASGEFDKIYNRLAGITGTGQPSTGQTGALGQNAATNIVGLNTGMGNARGASAIAQGNAYSGATNTIGNYYGQSAMLDKILAGRSSGGTSSTPSYYAANYAE